MRMMMMFKKLFEKCGYHFVIHGHVLEIIKQIKHVVEARRVILDAWNVGISEEGTDRCDVQRRK